MKFDLVCLFGLLGLFGLASLTEVRRAAQAEDKGVFQFDRTSGEISPQQEVFVTLSFSPPVCANFYRRVWCLIKVCVPWARGVAATLRAVCVRGAAGRRRGRTGGGGGGRRGRARMTLNATVRRTAPPCTWTSLARGTTTSGGPRRSSRRTWTRTAGGRTTCRCAHALLGRVSEYAFPHLCVVGFGFAVFPRV